MAENFYYVYALKDPRTSPAVPFYIGKGTGSRAFDHLVQADGTRKFQKIQEITASGHKPFVDILIDDLTENQALRIEAELVAAFGNLDTGGPLTNAVVPAGLGTKRRLEVVVPQGVVERAQLGLAMLKKAVLDLSSSQQARNHKRGRCQSTWPPKRLPRSAEGLLILFSARPSPA